MSRKIIVKGKVYRSVRDACIDLGIPYNTVYMTAKRHGVSVDELLNSYTIKPRNVKVAVTYDITLADGVVHQGVQMNELTEIVSAAAKAGVPVADMDITAHLRVIERKSRPGYTYDESVGNKRVVRLRENV